MSGLIDPPYFGGGGGGSAGVSSLNGLAGALSLTTPNSTLSIGTSGSNVTLDLNLSNRNTWTALQSFQSGLNVINGSNLQLLPTAATASLTEQNSGLFQILGSYWNGSASVNTGIQMNTNPTDTSGNYTWTIADEATANPLLAFTSGTSPQWVFSDGKADTIFSLIRASGINALYFGSSTSSTKLVPANTTGSVQDGALTIQSHGGKAIWGVDLNGNVSNIGNQLFSVNTYTANVSLGSASFSGNVQNVALINATSGAITVTLPAANSAKGAYFIIIKTDSSANAVTVTRSGTDTIEGATSKTLSSQYSKTELVSDGSSVWYDLVAGLV